MKTGFLAFLCLATLTIAKADKKEKEEKKQDPFTSTSIWEPIPINRQGFHAYLDKEIKKADNIDGFADNNIDLDGKRAHGEVLTNAILKEPKRFQIIIENLAVDHWEKVRYLKELTLNLAKFNNDYEQRGVSINPDFYAEQMKSFIDILKIRIDSGDIVKYIRENYTPGLYGNLHMFENNKQAKEELYGIMVDTDPETMLFRLREFANTPAADKLLSNTAIKSPNIILTYAKSTSVERDLVNRSKDPLIQDIVGLANNTDNSLRALPFIDDIHNKKLTYAEVNNIIKNDELYYKQLVKSKIEQPKIGASILARELKHEALDKYIRIVNELHDSPGPVRFKVTDNLNANELYYLMVLCSDEIYTSSFTGLYTRLLERMSPKRGDEFLNELNKDKFRTFIRMSAGYNTLKKFLATMNEAEKKTLMASFVHNIDDNVETDLEDAVDVADALASINDSTTLVFLQGELKKDYERTYQSNNKRGLIIYFLLHTLSGAILNPNDSSDALQQILRVPPITKVPYNELADDSGRVFQQHFFYGDEDGKSSFASFLVNFPTAKWTKEDYPKWIKLTSKTKKPIIIYANKPLEEPEDEQAQLELNTFLIENDIKPTILVHRGHSYHLPGTLKYIGPSNRIVILGSCGGYHNLSTILEQSEDANIISSKQTGTMRVNDPLLDNINERLINGKDVQWIPIWRELATKFKGSQVEEQFNDYVPPHKNMGALFLKAFKIQMAQLEE